MDTTPFPSSESYQTNSEKIESAVQVYPLNLEHCPHDAFYAKVDQFANPNNLLRDVEEAHYRVLATSFRNFNYVYAHSIIMVCFWSSVNVECAYRAYAVLTVEDKTMLKNSNCMVILDRRHWSHSVERL